MKAATKASCSHRSITRIRRSVLCWNDQDYDVSNLCLTPHTPSLYPETAAVQELPELDEQDTMELWQCLPKVSATAFQLVSFIVDDEKAAASSVQGRPFAHKTQQQQQQHNASPGPLSPISDTAGLLRSVTSHGVHRTPQQAAFQSSSRRNSLPAPVTRSAPLPVVASGPAARPKLDYKRLYSRGEDEEATAHPRRRSIAGGSGKHVSFQEQQLQRALEEEELQMFESEHEDEEEIPIPTPVSASDPLEPSYPMSCPLGDDSISSLSRPPPVEPSYPMPCPIDLPPPIPRPPRPVVAPTRVVHVQPDNNNNNNSRLSKCVVKDPLKDEKMSLKTTERAYRSPRPPSPPRSTSPCEAVMEIAPNVFVPYLGSQATWAALLHGGFTVNTCFACSLQLVVVDTVEFLVCPDCQTVSPLCFSDRNRTVERNGVGLGIKREWCDLDGEIPRLRIEGHHSPVDDDDFLALQAYPTSRD